MYYLILLFIMFFSFFISGCIFNHSPESRHFVSKQLEYEPSVSINIYPDAIWGAEGGGGEYYDPHLRDYLQEKVKKINYSANNSHLYLNFAIQNTSAPNAWVAPGYVVITRGLLVNLQSEAEFAFIIAREIGLLTHKNSLNKSMGGNFKDFGNLSAYDYDSGTILGLGSLSSGFLMNKYTRGEKIEAALLGLKYMSDAGYDPINAVKAQINFEKANEIYLKAILDSQKEKVLFNGLLGAHSGNFLKKDEIHRFVNNTPRSRISGDGEIREPFNHMLQNIRFIHNIYELYYDKALRYYEKADYVRAQHLLFTAIQKNPNQPCFYVLNGLIYLKMNDLNGADEYFNRAIKINSNYQPALSGLGQLYYKKGYFENSIDYLREAVYLFPDDVISNLYLGMGLFKLKKYSEAVLYLEKVTKLDLWHQFANGFLGVCYENIGDMHTAYNYYLKQAQINPNNEAGSIAQKKLSLIKKK